MARREPEQFAEVFDRHAPVIHRYAARRDAIGRRGVGIRWQVSDGSATAPGDTAMIILDPRTGAFPDSRTTYPGDRPGEYDGDAVAKLAVVDRPGQLP